MTSETSTALIAALETAFNRYLQLDPDAVQRMSRLAGSVICVVLEDWNLRAYVVPGAQGVQVFAHLEQPADTVLYTTPAALWHLARGGDAAHMMLKQELRIEGDTQLGQRFRDVLEQMQIDWEEHLSGVIGDVLAHQFMRGAKASGRWFSSASQSLEQDVSEFLQEETRIVPTGAEVLQFMDDVDQLRAAADRLEARVQRLRARLEPTSEADKS